jgi:outer membrane protein
VLSIILGGSMKKSFILTILICASLQLFAAEQKVGIVNFNTCIADSKLGKQEQNTFETMRKQLVSLIEDTNKQLHEISDNLQNKDVLDGLAKEAEDAMKAKFAQLNEELGTYQQQYYQFMNQGQYKIVQTVASGINQAAEQLASAKGYSVILNKEACFFSSPSLDITAEVLKTMDKQFDEDSKKQQAAMAPKVEEKKEAAGSPKTGEKAKK